MLSYTDLKRGQIIIYNNEPHEVLAADFLRMQQRKAVVQAKFKSLISGKVVSQNIHASDSFKEVEVDYQSIKYLYGHRGEYWFADVNNQNKRFVLDVNVLGEAVNFLKKDLELSAMIFNGKIINIKLPIKVDLEVIEAPPGNKGDTAGGGRKQVITETGAKVSTPLFINVGDIIKVNTQTGEYIERM